MPALASTITLQCQTCKERNYTTVKNKKNDPDRLEIQKFCPRCRKHTAHKETKKGWQPSYTVGADRQRGVAQLVEQRHPRPQVGRSSRSTPARLRYNYHGQGRSHRIGVEQSATHDSLTAPGPRPEFRGHRRRAPQGHLAQLGRAADDDVCCDRDRDRGVGPAWTDRLSADPNPCQSGVPQSWLRQR